MKKFSFFLLLLAAVSTLRAGEVVRLNPTTAEVRLDNGQRLFLDFYGPNIFRLFLDPAGGILRDPKAEPEAQILVDNPRKPVALRFFGNSIATDCLTVEIDPATGALKANGLQISAPEFQKGKTVVTLSQQDGEYFFGGGVQNGRFSHRGKIIAIENTNNWVDGGVASPSPYFWSTGGYGVMGYTFAPGKYDFGATEAGKTVLMHETPYLDYFFTFSQGAVALLNDYYQLTGHPVLLPKFGFYEGHLNAYNRDYWTEAENGFMAYEDGKRYNESQKDNGGVRESLNGELNNYQFSARAALDRYLDNDFPLGWFLPNDGYGAGYGQTATLDGNVQNLKEFGDYARSKGVEIGLWTQS
ncbi:MAG: alpha-xylosidase, partial [Bacteroidaceae bacterium]|nr:alpha-xylosidase [Bacteroidaceae bacterium]